MPHPLHLSMLRCVRSGVTNVNHGHRTFSQVPSRRAVGRASKPQLPRQPSTRSMRIEQGEMDSMPLDLGILPGTFITPSGANRPSLFNDPRKAIKFQWIRLKRKMQDAFVLLVYRWMNHKTQVRLRSRQIAPTAVALHKQMYTAFAEGDTATLKRICAAGLLDSFIARIHARGNELVKWELIKYTKRPKIMSHRAATLMKEGDGIRQAVVKLCSKQSLTRYRPNGAVVPGSGKERDVQEYLVIQKALLRGKEDDWIIWGTTEETSLEKLEEEER